MDVPGWQAAFLHVIIKDSSLLRGSGKLLHPVGKWGHGIEKVHLLFSCLPGIDTHHFCLHSIGEKQPTIWSHLDARVAEKCILGWATAYQQ